MVGLLAAYNRFAPVLEAAEPEESKADGPPGPDAGEDAVQTPTV